MVANASRCSGTVEKCQGRSPHSRSTAAWGRIALVLRNAARADGLNRRHAAIAGTRRNPARRRPCGWPVPRSAAYRCAPVDRCCHDGGGIGFPRPGTRAVGLSCGSDSSKLPKDQTVEEGPAAFGIPPKPCPQRCPSPRPRGTAPPFGNPIVPVSLPCRTSARRNDEATSSDLCNCCRHRNRFASDGRVRRSSSFRDAGNAARIHLAGRALLAPARSGHACPALRSRREARPRCAAFAVRTFGPAHREGFLRLPARAIPLYVPANRLHAAAL